jgi:hypothetical protein
MCVCAARYHLFLLPTLPRAGEVEKENQCIYWMHTAFMLPYKLCKAEPAGILQTGMIMSFWSQYPPILWSAWHMVKEGCGLWMCLTPLPSPEAQMLQGEGQACGKPSLISSRPAWNTWSPLPGELDC